MIRRHYANAVATLALVISLTGAGAYAADRLLTGKDIRNGSISSKDLARNSVRAPDIKAGAVSSTDIANGKVRAADIGTSAVQSAEIANGAVEPQDVTMPAPVEIRIPAGQQSAAKVGTGYEPITTVGSYNKVDPGSALRVDWTGSAGSDFAGCVFQLRVDGQPSGGGEVYVSSGGFAVSVSASGLFDGLPAGPHAVSVWARTPESAGATYPCTVGPTQASISQSFVVSESV